MTKYVYTFGGKKAEGNSTMKETLGGKGANLAEMTKRLISGTSKSDCPANESWNSAKEITSGRWAKSDPAGPVARYILILVRGLVREHIGVPAG